MSGIEAIQQEIVIEAPAARVFEAIANPEQLVKWWGFKDRFQAEQMTADLRPGGAWSMIGTREDKPFEVVGTYREVSPPNLLEFTWLPDWQEMRTPSVVRIELEETNGATTVRLTHSGFVQEADRANYRGWGLLLKLWREFVVAAH